MGYGETFSFSFSAFLRTTTQAHFYGGRKIYLCVFFASAARLNYDSSCRQPTMTMMVCVFKDLYERVKGIFSFINSHSQSGWKKRLNLIVKMLFEVLRGI